MGTMLVGLAVLALVVGVAHAGGLPPETDEALRNAKEIHVATRRPNGEWSRPAPIWFHWDGMFVYFTTSPESWKAKRIRGGSPVRIQPGGPDGPAFTGTTEIVSDPDVIRSMADAYAAKYWIAWLGFFRPRVARIESGKTVAVRVTPVSNP